MEDIPIRFKRFFWDVEIKKLDIIEHRIYIIERLLNEGDHQTLDWLFQTYSLDQIREAVIMSRGLTLKTALCWQNYFKLREDDMRCFSTYSINPV